MKPIATPLVGRNPAVQPKSSRPAPPPVYRPDFAGGIKSIAPASVNRIPSVQPKSAGLAPPPAYRPDFAGGIKSVTAPPPAYRPDFSIQSKPILPMPAHSFRQPPISSPFERIGHSARKNATLQPSCFGGLCTWIGSLFTSTPTNPYAALEMEPSQLPAWGAAMRVGYHWTAKWAEIRRSGEFRPGGGKFGDGIYVCESDHSWVPQVYHSLTTLLEVGYVGDTSRWSVLRIETMSDYDAERDETVYDVIETVRKSGPYNQTVYKMNGPHRISAANFRVRRVGA